MTTTRLVDRIRIRLPLGLWFGLCLASSLLGVVLQVAVPLDARELILLVVRLGNAPEGLGDLPRCRIRLRVLDGRLITNRVRRGEGEALHDVNGVGMDVSGRVEPGPIVL